METNQKKENKNFFYREAPMAKRYYATVKGIKIYFYYSKTTKIT